MEIKRKTNDITLTEQFNRKNHRRGKADTLNTQIHDRLLSWLHTLNTQIHDRSLSWLHT